MKKWIFVFASVLSFNTYGANDCGDDLDNNCWDCGRSDSDLCTARLNGTTLSVTGTGEMKDYGWHRGNIDEGEAKFITDAPWGNSEKGNTEIENITIDGITRVGNSAFLGSTNLENITFFFFFFEIGDNALHSSGLTHLELPPNLKTLGGGAIENLQFIREIVLPDGLETIGNGGFDGWHSLESIVIPDSVQTIGKYVFSDTPNLKSIVIGNGVISIEETAFSGVQKFCYSENKNECGTRVYIYCQNTAERSCRDLIGENNSEVLDRLRLYSVDDNGKIKVGSKTYDSLSDLPQYKLRRIYTIDEANAAAGPVNRVSIRYR